MKKILGKIRFFLFLISSFIKKHFILISLGFLLGSLSFFFFYKIVRRVGFKKTTRVGMVGKYTLNNLPFEIQLMISDGLTKASPSGEISPGLAETWEINNEGKEYIFHLKDNIYWHDGKPVRAGDINYKFSDVAIIPLDEKTIKFELKESFSPFLSVISQPTFKKDSVLIGTGEYRVARIKRNGQIIEKLLLISRKDKSRLLFKFYPTEQAIRTAFKLGEIDTIKEIADTGDLVLWPKIKIIPQVKYNQFVGIFFNTTHQTLANKSTRQALAYAIQKRWPYRALNPINPYSWAYNPNVKPYNFDLEKAKKLLKNSDEKEQLLKEIELSTIPSLIQVAEEIKNDWEKLEITCKIKVTNNLEEPFQAFLITQEIPIDPDQYIFWHSTQELNITRYKSPKIDKLLEEGRKILEKEKRKEVYRDFQKFITEEAPVVFLFHPTLYTISRL